MDEPVQQNKSYKYLIIRTIIKIKTHDYFSLFYKTIRAPNFPGLHLKIT